MNPKVALYLSNVKRWRKELELLRMIILECMLTEELKWGVPVYTFKHKNIVGINELKESCALAFFKGALLNDSSGILIRPGKNTQAGRWLKFTSVQQIVGMQAVLKDYIYEAIEVEKVGLKLKPGKILQMAIPEEFGNKMRIDPGLKKAFEALTPGRQRAYLLYFSAAKQPKTRLSRVEKSIRKFSMVRG